MRYDRPRPIGTILLGGSVAGALLVVDQILVFSPPAKGLEETLQYIASALIGGDAFSGGYEAAALGIVFHFVIAFTTAGIYYEASRVLPRLFKQPMIWGPLFGVCVYIVMNYIVVPLTAAPKIPFSWGLLINGVLGHALLVGLPIALFANISAHAHWRRY